MPRQAEAGLIRSIGKWDLVAVTVNAVVGAGIFSLPSKVYGLAGAYSLPAFLLCAVFAGMIVLCFAEVGSRFSESGGPYLYAREAFGPGIGVTIGWLMWIARIAAFAANTSIMLDYLGLFWPAVASGPQRSALICSFMRDVAVSTNIFTVGKLAPLALFVVAGVPYLDLKNLSFGAPPSAAARMAGRISAAVITDLTSMVAITDSAKNPSMPPPKLILGKSRL